MVYRKSPVMFFLSLIISFAAFFFVLQTEFSFAQTTDIVIQDYQLVNKTRVGRTTFEYIFKANIANNGSDNFSNVTGSLTSLVPTVIVTDNSLTFDGISAGSTTTSTDTFAVRIDRRVPFNDADVNWTFTGTPVTDDDSIVVYTYDNYDRLVMVVYENGTNIGFSYDANGNLVSKTVDVVE